MPEKDARSAEPPRRRGLAAADFARIYDLFSAPISQRFDCGRFCAPLNGGSALCCSTQHTVPVATRAEWTLLRGRTDLWRRFRPYDWATRQIVAELPRSCTALACKGAAFCERDNRTLACRSFPFFPYFTRARSLVGISVYPGFEDRCWVVSNLWIVEKKFVAELIAGYEHLFALDADEEEAFVDQSAQTRRIFSRRGKPFPVIGRKGGVFKVRPKSGGKLVPARIEEFRPHWPYTSQRAYRGAIREEGGDPNAAPQLPDRPQGRAK